MKYIVLLLLCVTVAYARLNTVHFLATSVKSDVFAPLRPTEEPVSVIGCSKVVVGPSYGVLEYAFKRGEGPQNGKCTFILQAPPNHRVNIVSIAFDLLDSTSDKETSEYSETSTINLYDSDKPDENNFLTAYFAAARERQGAFLQSISSAEKMVVQINYRDNTDYATQKFHITYEYLDADKMAALLEAV